jgi:hypothetical protein
MKVAPNWYEGNHPPQEVEAVGLHDAILWFGQYYVCKNKLYTSLYVLITHHYMNRNTYEVYL